MPEVPTPEDAGIKEAVEAADVNKDQIIDAKEKEVIQRNIAQLRDTIANGDKQKQQAFIRAAQDVVREYQGLSGQDIGEWIFGRNDFKKLSTPKKAPAPALSNTESHNTPPVPGHENQEKIYKFLENLGSLGDYDEGGEHDEEDDMSEYDGQLDETFSEALEAPEVDNDYILVSETDESFMVDVTVPEDAHAIHVYKYDQNNDLVIVSSYNTDGETELELNIPHEAGTDADYFLRSVDENGYESQNGVGVSVEVNEVPVISNFEVNPNPVNMYNQSIISFDISDANGQDIDWEIVLDSGYENYDGHISTTDGNNIDSNHCSGTVSGSGTVEITFQAGWPTNAAITIQITDNEGGVVTIDPYIIGVQ